MSLTGEARQHWEGVSLMPNNSLLCYIQSTALSYKHTNLKLVDVSHELPQIILTFLWSQSD